MEGGTRYRVFLRFGLERGATDSQTILIRIDHSFDSMRRVGIVLCTPPSHLGPEQSIPLTHDAYGWLGFPPSPNLNLTPLHTVLRENHCISAIDYHLQLSGE